MGEGARAYTQARHARGYRWLLGTLFPFMTRAEIIHAVRELKDLDPVTVADQVEEEWGTDDARLLIRVRPFLSDPNASERTERPIADVAAALLAAFVSSFDDEDGLMDKDKIKEALKEIVNEDQLDEIDPIVEAIQDDWDIGEIGEYLGNALMILGVAFPAVRGLGFVSKAIGAARAARAAGAGAGIVVRAAPALAAAAKLPPK